MKNSNEKQQRRSAACIKINENLIFYNEIVHPLVFKDLYASEKPIVGFFSKISLCSRPFATFLAKERKNAFHEGDVLLIRVSKKDRQAQYVSKVYKWGKIHIPKIFTNALDVKNDEEVYFEVIAENQILDANKECIDLGKIRETTIPRANGYITIYAKRKTPITLPQIIRPTPELFELCYLIHGDGHYGKKLYFANKEPELHEFVLQQFEKNFKVPRDLWRARVLLSDVNYGDDAKNYWKNKLNLDENQFYSVSKAKLNTSNRGNLRIIVDKTILSEIFRFVFEQIKMNKENLLHALNGLLDAEGGAQISKKGLHKITLSFNQKEKEMFKEILDRLQLHYSIEQDRTFIIQGWKKQYRFFKTFLSKKIAPFNMHPKRKRNALRGFLTHSFTKTMVKYLSILKQNSRITVKEFSKLLKIREDSILSTMRKLQYSEFIDIEGKGIRANPYIISITNEGDYFLNMIKEMEVMKCEAAL